jgi:hypothetical protein
VLQLFDAGETMTAICRRLFGYKNQAKLERVKKILLEQQRITE